jgi:hypothetical protein
MAAESTPAADADPSSGMLELIQRRPTVWRIALAATLALVLTGCVLPEDGEPMFRVTNHTTHALIIRPPHDQNASSQYVYPGDTVSFRIDEKGCTSRPWSVTTEAGKETAAIPGACVGHYWTIRGHDDSTYE